MNRVLPAVFSLTVLITAQAVEIADLPRPAEPRVIKFAEPREKTLANGLRVIAVERPGLPLLSAAFVIRRGAESDPANLAGLAHFTAKLLLRGTTTRSAPQIAAETEALGASLATHSTWDATTISLTTLSAQAGPAFSILADVVRRPKFAAAEITRQRTQMLDDLRVAMEEPSTLARLAAGRFLLGAGLYAHPPEGTPTSLARLRRASIVTFYRTHWVPAEAQLVVAGDLSSDAIFELTEKTFGDWKPSGAPAAAALPEFTPVKTPRTLLIDLPNAGQAAVLVVAPGISRQSPDYFTAEIADGVLGGGYSSRLNEEIRVKRGLSYGAGSALTALRGGGWFTAACQTKNSSAAEVAKVIKAELARLATEPVPADYFSGRVAVVTGAFARDLETNANVATTVSNFALYDWPLESVNTYPGMLQRVTTEDVLSFTAAHLDPATASVLIVGRAQECAPVLRELFPDLAIISSADLDLDSPTLRRSTPR